MNIFFLSLFPIQCAAMHIDLHVRKMIIEYAQLLCTAHRVLDGTMIIERSNKNRKIKRWVLKSNDEQFYKATHVNHPCSKWTRLNSLHYTWLYELFVALCDEYQYRFHKVHLTDVKLRAALKRLPMNIPLQCSFQCFPLAMPVNYQISNSVIECYRTFYQHEKQATKAGKPMNHWTNRTVPFFMRISFCNTKQL